MSVAQLCEQLVRDGCDIAVYTTTANGPRELEVIPNQTLAIDAVSVTYFKRITKDHSHFSPALLKAVWKTAKTYDVVHVHAWWNLVSVIACFIAIWHKVPVLVSARGTLSPYSFQHKNRTIKRLIHHLINKPLLKKCHFHATSKREHEAINKVIKSKSITSIFNFVKHPVSYRSLENNPSSTFRLLFLSRIEEKKGLDILISALSQVKVPFHLTIAGSGDQDYIKHLKSMAMSKNIAERITWTGFVNENKFEILQQHDLLVLPSYDENFGNVVIESLAVGTPVLISDQVGLADYVIKNQLGWLCQTNSRSVAENIEKIAGQEAELDRIRRQAPDLIGNDFNENRLVKKYIDLYNTIL
jgi:glycosyltransferase involved in cell wall biosynthesis